MTQKTRDQFLGTRHRAGTMAALGLAVAAILAACASPQGADQGAAGMSAAGMSAAVTAAPLLGDVEVDSSCTPTQATYISQWAFATRVILTSKGFEDCVRQRAETYIRCEEDPAGPAVETALIAARNINDVGVSCDFSVTRGLGSTGLDTYANYDRDDLSMHWWLLETQLKVGVLANPLDDLWSRDPWPWPLTTGVEIIAHEAIHQQGYAHWDDPAVPWCTPVAGVTTAGCVTDADCWLGEHCTKAPNHTFGRCASYDMREHSMPYIVGQCVAEIAWLSQSCGLGFCSGRVEDDISACQASGRLVLYEGPGSCGHYYDPNARGVGMLLQDEGAFRVTGLVPYGQRTNGQAAGWMAHADDTFTWSSGQLDSSSAADEVVVRSSWGLGVLSTLGGYLTTVDAKPFGTRLSHTGDGTGEWVVGTNDTFHAPRRYSGGFVDEILVRNSNYLGLLSIASGALRTRSVVASGTALSGSNGSWRVGAGDLVTPGLGDFNGDGRADILLRSGWGMGLISHSGSSGTWRTLDLRGFGQAFAPIAGCTGSDCAWTPASGDSVISAGDYNGDGRLDVLIRSSTGLAIIGMPSGQTRLTTMWKASFGTVVSGWTLAATDRVSGKGRLESTTKDSLILQGAGGLAVLRFSTGAAPTASIHSSQKISIGGKLNAIAGAGGTHWTYADSNAFHAVADFDGDGYDSFLIRSSWGYGIVGRDASSAALKVQLIRQYNCGDADDTSCHGSLIGSWLARETDQILVTPRRTQSGTARALLLRNLP